MPRQIASQATLYATGAIAHALASDARPPSAGRGHIATSQALLHFFPSRSCDCDGKRPGPIITFAAPLRRSSPAQPFLRRCFDRRWSYSPTTQEYPRHDHRDHHRPQPHRRPLAAGQRRPPSRAATPPAPTRSSASSPPAAAEEARQAVAAARAAFPAWRRDQPHPPGRAVRQPRPARQARHRRPRPADGPRVRQGRHRVPGRGRRRPAHDPVRLRHRPHADRRRAGLGDRREGRLHAPQAVGRRRRHHAVELPLRRAAVDARAQPARRQHRRLQAVGGHARHRPAPGRAVRGGRLSAGRDQPGSRRRRGRRGAGAQSRRQRRAVHRQLRRRPAHSGSCRPSITTASSPRDGQQERRHRLRRRPARPGRQLRASSAPSRPAASAASRRAASSSPRRSSTASPRSSWPRRSGCASATRSTPATSPARSSTAARSRRSLRYNDLARKEGATGAARRRPDDARRARGTGCYLSPFVYRMEHRPGRALHPRGGLRPAPGADPVQEQRGRGPHLQRHATTACRWR